MATEEKLRNQKMGGALPGPGRGLPNVKGRLQAY